MDTHISHLVKVFRIGGGIDYIRCVSEEDAKIARKERVKQGDVKCALIGTCEEINSLDAMGFLQEVASAT